MSNTIRQSINKQLSQFDDEPFKKNPLLKFNLSSIRKKQKSDELQRRAQKAKKSICRSSNSYADITLERILRDDYYYKEKLQQFTIVRAIPQMLPRMERKILNWIPLKAKQRYSFIVKNYMNELTELYHTVMKDFSLSKVIKQDNKSKVATFRFKNIGKTQNYDVFVQNRTKLMTILLITKPYIRCILAYWYDQFPRYFIDVEKFRKRPVVNVDEFKRDLSNELARNTLFIQNVWYPKVVSIFRKYLKKHIPKKLLKRAANCASGLINRQLNETKMKTINKLINSLLNRNTIPLIPVACQCHPELTFIPSVDEICACFTELVDEILAVGTSLDPILYELDGVDSKILETFRWKIEIGPVYPTDLKQCFENVIKIIYSEVSTFYLQLENQFLILYNEAKLQEWQSLQSESISFEDCLTKIMFVKNLVEEVKSLVDYEIFEMCTVSMVEAKQDLRKLADTLLNRMFDTIFELHDTENTKICNEFESIRRQALKHPLSTEELLDSGDKMLYIKNQFMNELIERIQDSLKKMGILMDFREISETQLEKQIETITWPRRIKFSFEENASNYEQFKFIFEEKLTQVQQKLVINIDAFIPKLTILNDMNNDENLRENSLLLSKFLRKISILEDTRVWINKEEALFKQTQTTYPKLDDIRQFVHPFYELIRNCIKWLRFYGVWMDGPFEYLSPENVSSTTEEFQREFLKILKYYKKQIKEDVFRGSSCQFRGSLDDADFDNHPVPIHICQRMLQLIKDFRIGVYTVSIMCNPALKDRHWDEMSKIAGFDVTPNAGTSLRKLLVPQILELLEKFEMVSISADKELQLYTNLQTMTNEWDAIMFTLSMYKDTGLTILTQLDDIQCILDDHITKTLTMRGSAFVKPYEVEVTAWYEKLIRVNNTIDQWGKVQSNWLYLLPIFSSKDIVEQMVEEGRKFAQVDSIYKRYMAIVAREPKVMETAPTPGMLEAMASANEMLEEITVGVNNYLEKKRLYFPRFFFLSNDEMLEILSETKNPLRVQPHLNKCFEGINRLNFDSSLKIHSMFSIEKEEIPFLNVINTEEARGSVEKWLLRVQEEMLKAIKEQLLKSYIDYSEKIRNQWAIEWPGMIVLCISQIYWSANITSCLSTNSLDNIKKLSYKLNEDLNDIVALIRSKITNLQRITVKALIVIDVHAKDVVDDLVKKKVNSQDDFNWLAQLRYYLDEEIVLVKIINAEVVFANEYLGNSDRLVITPLTDRCYRTLMGAYQLHLNGAPEGPAGTGKTETTKDLAKALAVQCKVFNCSDGLDYKAMGKFFKGLASCGAWACFDEFNRIELEVLSVVAQQILCIVVAVRADQTSFIFEGTTLQLNPACYVCITMNPGYAGRSELPDNLKVLFRTVAMMIPDYAMIGEISLYSFGFVNARNLAVKIVTTYRLCSEQLSSQNHYDYGMRAVKTVLQACGNLKKAHPDENEEILLLRSLLDVNLPKFLSFDLPLFSGIINDLFPEIRLPKPDYDLLSDAFKNACKKMNLQPHENFLTKVIQTFEMMIVRHGFMMVGEPFAGKSSTIKVLAECLNSLEPTNANPYFKNVQVSVINPKSVTMGQLYGAFDPVSYEWTDGIASTIFRRFASDTSPDRKWLIFDGPVDAVWIENLNTVLDDNKTLCLTSGEVIRMSSEMSMIFEVMDLAQASPATVSRCGMIYMESISLGWESFVRSWLNNQYWIENYENELWELIGWCIPYSIEFVRKNCKQFLYPGETKLLIQTLTLVEMLILEAIEDSPDEKEKFLIVWIQAALLLSTVWGLGGLLDDDSRKTFDAFIKQLWKGMDELGPPPTNISKIEVSLPSEGLLYDYSYFFKQKGFWRQWTDVAKMQKHENVSQEVPTIDTVRYNYLFNMHIKHSKPVLLVGPTGTGKSFYIQNMMMQLDSEIYIPIFITFTTQITANQTQDLILSKLHKHRRGVYGSPKGKSIIMFIDDMNMPAKEVYGAQPPIELIRQYFDQKTWFDFTDASAINLSQMLVLAACGLVGGSRQDVYARFLCHFNLLAINAFSESTMQKIFSSILLDAFRKSGHGADTTTPCIQMVNATLETYKFSINELKPTPAKSHYVFNLRDISRVITGCTLLKKESVTSRKTFARIWVHEALRVFYDRLVDNDDRKLAFNNFINCTTNYFRERPEDLFSDYILSDKVDQDRVASKLFFGSYFNMDVDAEDRRYDEITEIETFRELAHKCLQDYNAVTRNKMNLVLFDYALQHLNRICRIMTIPAGSTMLVGVNGSGRQSLTRLAASILNQRLYQPDITKNYGMNDWREDLKKVLRESGGKGQDVVFLFNQGQIKLEAFLQDIDCLLNLGEVPNIFAIDEKQEIMELVRLAAQGGNRSLDISSLHIFQFFINRTKQKLHVVLCFSPIGSGFRTYTRLYPSLVNCCTINWFDDWPDEALRVLAIRYIENIDLNESVKPAIVRACQRFHLDALKEKANFLNLTGRNTYVTSASFLELMKSYAALIKIKQQELKENKMRYLVGLDKLNAAANAVSTMQENLNKIQPALVVLAKESKEMASQIEKETIDAALATEQVKKDEIVANVKAVKAKELKAECEADLVIALPILNRAEKELNTLKPQDITLVKTMQKPSDTIKLVMAAIVVMKGGSGDKVKDQKTGKIELDYWPPAKRMIGEMDFLQSLKDYDKDNIKPDIMAKIRKDFIPNPIFLPKVVAKASAACRGLCAWVIAMDKYDDIAKVVAPKKAKLADAEREFADTMEDLNQKRALAEQLELKVKKLNEDLEEAQMKMKQLEDEVDLCKSKLLRAESLIRGLGGEKSRWIQAAEYLQSLFDNLPGDILLSSGVIAYLSPFTSIFRSRILSEWCEQVRTLNIPMSNTYFLVGSLGSEIIIQEWNLCGLPRDNFSTENAIINMFSQKFSLFMDPQGQANKWIKQFERHNQIKVVKFSQSDYMKKLEKCIEFGNAALIENVLEEIDVALDTLLAKNTFLIGGQESISLGDNIIPFSPNFRLYFTSNLRNPHYLPEVFNKLTLINFSLTPEGLEDQLLGIVVSKERPDLQELKQKLVQEGARNKAMLKEVEDGILTILSESKGDILEDEKAIQMLDSSKQLSLDIKAKQEEAILTEVEIEKFRLSYVPVASYSTVLYYCVTDLPNIDPMYQFSLNWFINLYQYSIANAKKSKELPKRLSYLKEAAIKNLYNNVCRSLFEKDKLLFSFILTTKLMIANNQLDRKEFDILVNGPQPYENKLPNPDPLWITSKMWNSICGLEQLNCFDGFIDNFIRNLEKWKSYFSISEPQQTSICDPWNDKTNFQHLIIINSIRPDKTADALALFVEKEFGKEFVTPPQFNIAQSFQDSTALSPLIFILSPGADPMIALLLYAERSGYRDTFRSISLGQGQGVIAEELIKTAQESGNWVCLQNCHLAASWMPTLEYLLENMDGSNTDPAFRLWLTSYPSDKFPTSILQNGTKMTNEPPTGLKKNLLRSYLSEPINDTEFYESCAMKDFAFKRLLFGTCFFHAVVQERRSFGALGWNIPYGFNESDFQISVRQIQLFLNSPYEIIPYEAITYLIGECNYGGRVTDTWDRRLICTLLDNYINIDVVESSKYRFSDDLSFTVPSRIELEHNKVNEFIEMNVPDSPSPDVYGLHPNAGIQKDLGNSHTLLNSILVIGQGTASKAGADTNSEKILLRSIVDINKNLPPQFDLEEIKKQYPVDYNESMNTVLVQEVERFNKLLLEIRITCKEVQQAIKGLIVMTPALEDVCNSIQLKKIPSRWLKKSYPSLKPIASYITDFVERLKFFELWRENGKPTTFWLSGFFFTQAFLTGAMQNYARTYKIPVDTLTFDFSVLKVFSMEKAPMDGVYVYGLFLEGARWLVDDGSLDEQLPKVLVESMPLIHFQPILLKNMNERGRYKSPLYKTQERRGTLSTTGHSTNYVLPILLETRHKPSHHWIKRSVALVCQTTD